MRQTRQRALPRLRLRAHPSPRRGPSQPHPRAARPGESAGHPDELESLVERTRQAASRAAGAQLALRAPLEGRQVGVAETATSPEYSALWAALDVKLTVTFAPGPLTIALGGAPTAW